MNTMVSLLFMIIFIIIATNNKANATKNTNELRQLLRARTRTNNQQKLQDSDGTVHTFKFSYLLECISYYEICISDPDKCFNDNNFQFLGVDINVDDASNAGIACIMFANMETQWSSTSFKFDGDEDADIKTCGKNSKALTESLVNSWDLGDTSRYQKVCWSPMTANGVKTEGCYVMAMDYDSSDGDLNFYSKTCKSDDAGTNCKKGSMWIKGACSHSPNTLSDDWNDVPYCLECSQVYL